MERFTRQQSQTTTPQPAPGVATPVATKPAGNGSSSLMPSKLLAVSLVLVGIALIVALVMGAFGSLKSTSLAKSDRYQAVFLDNGQVYFGKLSDVNREYIRLVDIYYLQVEQQVQPEQVAVGETASTAEPQISLAKLGNELHGPEDEMFILRSKVTFWENLKDDGQVVTAIKEFVQKDAN